MSCVFCARIALADYVGCGRGVVRFEPLNPVTPGHMLFVPLLHVYDAAMEPWVTGNTFEVAAAWGRSTYQPFNLITSVGEEATQSVWHLHVHYVPRAADDGLHLPWTGQATP